MGEDGDEVGEIEGFADETVGGNGRGHGGEVATGAHREDGNTGGGGITFEFGGGLGAGKDRHHEVHENGGGRVGADALDGFGAVDRLVDLIAFGTEEITEEFANGVVVVDDENARCPRYNLTHRHSNGVSVPVKVAENDSTEQLARRDGRRLQEGNPLNLTNVGKVSEVLGDGPT
jgi:hypothetical protein